MTLKNNTDGMERVICVPARVPIVKIWDPELKLAADLNVNNPLALENTRMVKAYVMIDERVRELAMIIKYWTRQRILNDAGKFFFSSTTLPIHPTPDLTRLTPFL
jgi:DNA polymerase sigma